MRGVVFAVVAGWMGCATTGHPTATDPAPAPAKAAPAKPAPSKPEIVVVGRGPTPIPGLRSTDQGLDFTVYHGRPYRCTKMTGGRTPRTDEEVEKYCRDLGTSIGQGSQGGEDKPPGWWGAMTANH